MILKKRNFSAQNGQVLIISAVSLLLLLGFVGMAVDAGFVYHSKARLRAATDAAVLDSVNQVCIKLPDIFYNSTTDISQAIEKSNSLEKMDLNSRIKELIEKSIKGPKIKVELLSKPWGIKVTSTLAVKSYFSKVFGVKEWTVSLISKARVSLPGSVGFSQAPLETSGMRPFGIITPVILPNMIKPDAKIKLSSLSQNYESPAVKLLYPDQSAPFSAIVRAAKYGCPVPVAINDRLFSHKQAFQAAKDQLMLVSGQNMTIPVVKMSGAKYSVTGFIRASFFIDSSADWYIHVKSLLKPRPVLEI